MITQLFRPKWERSDPRVRRRAFESGAVPAEAVERAARSDSDPEVRRSAVACLEDLDLLAELSDYEPMSAIREAACHRRRALLASPLRDGPPLQARLKAIRRLPTSELCALLAREVQAAEIRAAAVNRVADTELLCTLAVDDPVAAVRRAALERIEEPRGWEVVARKARNKDKQISRIARERLDTFHKARSERESAEQLCGSMQRLAQGAATAASRADFHRLTLQWDKLECALPASLKERFEQASQGVVAALERFESLLNQRRALCAELEALLGSLRDSRGRDTALDQAESDRLPSIMRRWEALARDAHEDQTLAEQFAGLVEQVQREVARLALDGSRASRLRELIEKARAAVDAPAELDERRVKGFKRRWTELELPETKYLADMLQQEFDGVLHALRERLERQIRQRKQALQEAGQFLRELEQALEKGKLEHALSLRDRIRHRLKTAKGVDESQRAAVQECLHAIYPQLDNLRDWRHWGSGQSRERLCSETEALAGSALSAAEIAGRVRNAREAWKHIDRAEGPAPEALWQRFDAACTRAYAPYQEQRREQMAQLDAHRAQKQALCAELETLERDTDWKTVDWSEADQSVRALRQRWRRVGPLPRKGTKALEQRYRDVLERLESHLGREREREVRRRRALIERVEALVDAPDPRVASREVKEAQNNWKPRVQADKRTEQALWQQFRAACDAVFNRISAERDATERERQANLQRKKTLCDEIERLLNDAKADFLTVSRRFAEAGDEWRKVGPIPRKAERGVAARYEALGKALAERQQQAANAAAEALMEGVRERGRLCERLEAGVLEGCLAEADRKALLQETARAWELLGPLEHACAAALRERFECASRALAGDAEARQLLQNASTENLRQRLDLCLQLEVEAGVDSPAEFAEARMQLQVSRLEDALKHRHEAAAVDRLRALQIAWHQVGPLPEKDQPALEARFARALAALQRP